MPGINELIILIAVIAAIFFLPRLFKSKRNPGTNTAATLTLSGHMRLAMAVSILWFGGAAAFLEPWKEEILPFVYFGIAPVISGWGLGWVFEGFRKR